MKRGSALYRVMDRYVGIPVLFLTSIARRGGKLPAAIGRIGVLTSPTLGDTLLASGVIQDLRTHYPAAKIIFFYSPTNAAAADLLPCVDELVAIKMTDPVTSRKTIRAQQLDLMFDTTPWQRVTAFLTASSGARYKVGFAAEGQHRHFHYDLAAKHSRERHEVDNFRSLLTAMGIDSRTEPRLNLSWMEDQPPTPGERTIAFHPWASGGLRHLREWPAANWVALATALNRPGTRFLITGGPAQQAESETLVRAMVAAGLHAAVFAGGAGFRPLCTMIRHAALVVSVNTGVMHLAAVMGTPTIGLNGPTSELRWGPRGRRAIGVGPHGGGGGFLHLGFEFKGNPTDSMERTRVEDVVEAAHQVMEPRIGTETVPSGPETSSHSHA